MACMLVETACWNPVIDKRGKMNRKKITGECKEEFTGSREKVSKDSSNRLQRWK